MSTFSSEEIISILKDEIENYDVISRDQETGSVVSVGDGIATVYGIDHAMYGEIVTFENGEKGMVQDIRRDTIGCILFGKDTGIREGTRVTRTKKKAGIPVGENFIGRVINALGEPIDGQGPVQEADYYPVEREAPGIVERKSVSVPLETGILAIDSMFPIDHRRPPDGKNIHCHRYHPEPEGKRCDLYLCGHRTESVHHCQTGVNAEKT